MPEPSTSALRAVSDAVLAVASRLSVEDVLQGLVDEARVLGGARYAALGIPDGAGGFSRFLVAGMSDELIAAMGPLPRTHGMLGAILVAPGPYRTDDIHTHPRFKGWWPSEHPDMRSFLGVPIVAEGEVIGAFYLTEKQGAERFSDTDQEIIELLAAHAAIAITNARLYEHSRELSVLSERNRLALELHDVVSQKLFALVLGAEAAATTLDRDPEATRGQLQRLQSLSREALDELRSLVLELRPPDLDRDGLCGTLTKHVELVRRLHDAHIDLDLDAGVTAGAERDREILRVAQEALHNALRHADARRVRVSVRTDGAALVLEVADDGIGFDPDDAELRSRHLGLTSMEERARRIGGQLRIDPTPGGGATVRLQAPRA
ncbi:MAG: GAF domain-containing sensor histidine kinase [Solirubrobacteraceae bacterium]